jgi:hypothetical protein
VNLTTNYNGNKQLFGQIQKYFLWVISPPANPNQSAKEHYGHLSANFLHEKPIGTELLELNHYAATV